MGLPHKGYPSALSPKVLYIIYIGLSIKDNLGVPQTPLFITFADLKKFCRAFSGGWFGGVFEEVLGMPLGWLLGVFRIPLGCLLAGNSARKRQIFGCAVFWGLEICV